MAFKEITKVTIQIVMPYLIPNFEYDIFISYRHNDNLPNRSPERLGNGVCKCFTGRVGRYY